jgi:hypothetical protein
MKKRKNLISTSQEKGFKNDFGKKFKQNIMLLSF